MKWGRHAACWVAAIAFFVFGAVWYGVFEAPWSAAIGRSFDQIAREQGGRPQAYAIGFVSILVMCYALAWLIERLEASTLAGGLKLGAGIALCFVAASLALNYGFEARPMTLWLINAAYAVIGLGVAGAIIGGWKRPA
ncbi:MAG TPA: DUF1761 domain-containing protein [Casimicrobiaceae bacterium]|nr:DUF1761 domain-containing protein [Casimicrobiaceae bacterium]